MRTASCVLPGVVQAWCVALVEAKRGQFRTSHIRLDPSEADVYLNRSQAYLVKESYDLAVADATQSIRHNPNKSTHAYTIRAAARANKGLHDEAIADATRAIDSPGRMLRPNCTSPKTLAKAMVARNAASALRRQHGESDAA